MAYKRAAEVLQAKVKASLGDKFSIISVTWSASARPTCWITL